MRSYHEQSFPLFWEAIFNWNFTLYCQLKKLFVVSQEHKWDCFVILIPGERIGKRNGKQSWSPRLWQQRIGKGSCVGDGLREKWNGKEDFPAPSGERETENWAKSTESSTANEERDESGCGNSTHPVLSSAISQKNTSKRSWLFRLLSPQIKLMSLA